MKFISIRVLSSAAILGLSAGSMAHADYYQGQKKNTYNSTNTNNASNVNNRNTSANANVSDRDLAKKVKDKIGSGWFSKGYDQVEVQVSNGVVNLSGQVATWDDKQKVENDVRNIDGVRSVFSQITVEERTTRADDSQYNQSRSFNDRDSGRRYDQQRNTNQQFANPNGNRALNTDQQLAKKIEDKIGPGWFSRGYDQVHFEVNNGVVTLNGFVTSWDDKQKVENEVRNIDGVTRIISQIRVQEGATKDGQTDMSNRRRNPDVSQSDYFLKNQTTKNQYGTVDTAQPDSAANTRNASASASDRELQKKIEDKIGPGWFSNGYDQVKVQVNNGVATLRGSVKTWEEKDKVERDVRDIKGVTRVVSQITVQDQTSTRDNGQRSLSQDQFATPSDEQLNKKIRDKISKGWFSNSYKNVSLNTNNGVVTLEGTVDEINDQQKLMREIQDVNGVKLVRSNLRVNNQ